MLGNLHEGFRVGSSFKVEGHRLHDFFACRCVDSPLHACNVGTSDTFPLEAGAHNFDIIGSEVHDVQPLIETKTLVEIERTALSLSDLIPLVVIHYADDLEEVVFKDRVAIAGTEVDRLFVGPYGDPV